MNSRGKFSGVPEPWTLHKYYPPWPRDRSRHARSVGTGNDLLGEKVRETGCREREEKLRGIIKQLGDLIGEKV